MCSNFKTEIDVAQNLIDDFFSNFVCQRTFPYIQRILSENMGVRD